MTNDTGLMKNEKRRREITSHDEETFRRHFEILLFLSWLKVTSGPKQRKDRSWNWLGYAKYAAWLLLDSPANRAPELFMQEVMRVIGFQSLTKNKEFFIQLGRCLTGEIDRQLVDKRDIDIAEIVLVHPELSAGDAVRELERRDHRGITEENFRMWKMRLLKAKKEYDAVQADEAYDLAHGK
jgi:hypothetical protein